MDRGDPRTMSDAPIGVRATEQVPRVNRSRYFRNVPHVRQSVLLADKPKFSGKGI